MTEENPSNLILAPKDEALPEGTTGKGKSVLHTNPTTTNTLQNIPEPKPQPTSSILEQSKIAKKGMKSKVALITTAVFAVSGFFGYQHFTKEPAVEAPQEAPTKLPTAMDSGMDADKKMGWLSTTRGVTVIGKVASGEIAYMPTAGENPVFKKAETPSEKKFLADIQKSIDANYKTIDTDGQILKDYQPKAMAEIAARKTAKQQQKAQQPKVP